MGAQNTPGPAIKLTKTQVRALEAAFKKGGAWYGRRGSNAGGAYHRLCLRLASLGLVGAYSPYEITVPGLIVLRDLWAKRWAKHGCMAYLMDLEAVEAAIAGVPRLAAIAKARGQA